MKKRPLRRTTCVVEGLEQRVAMAAGIDAHEVYSWQIINLMREDPARFASDLDSLHRNQPGTYHGYTASDPVWTELRGSINDGEGANGWSFSSMRSFLASQPKLPRLLLQEDLTVQANNHTLWMQAHGYAHTGTTTRGLDLPGFTQTAAPSPDAWDHPAEKYATPSGENISYGFDTDWAFEAPFRAGTLSADGFQQRLAYYATLSYILDAGQPDLGHLRNLLSRPDSLPASGSGITSITNMDSIGIDQTFLRFQQVEDVPNYYLTTHRLDNVLGTVTRVGQYSTLNFTDANGNGLFDVGETYALQLGGPGSTANPIITPPPGSAPRVVGLRAVRTRGGVSSVVIQFDSAMDAGSVADLAGYRLTMLAPGKKARPRAVRLTRAFYDSETMSVTLTLARRAQGRRLRITIDDAIARGASGQTLAGGDFAAPV